MTPRLPASMGSQLESLLRLSGYVGYHRGTSSVRRSSRRKQLNPHTLALGLNAQAIHSPAHTLRFLVRQAFPTPVNNGGSVALRRVRLHHLITQLRAGAVIKNREGARLFTRRATQESQHSATRHQNAAEQGSKRTALGARS